MARSKHSTNFFLILGAVALIYVVTGLRKLFGIGSVTMDFESWGYAPMFMYLLGIVELLGAVGLVFSRTRIPAMAGLSVVMLGAIGTHIINAEYYRVLLPLVLLLLLAALFIMSREEIAEANLTEDDQANY